MAGARGAVVAGSILTILGAGCARRAEPTYEYDRWVTTTSVGRPTASAPPAEPAAPAPEAPGTVAAPAPRPAPAGTPRVLIAPTPTTVPGAAPAPRRSGWVRGGSQ